MVKGGGGQKLSKIEVPFGKPRKLFTDLDRGCLEKLHQENLLKQFLKPSYHALFHHVFSALFCILECLQWFQPTSIITVNLG